MFSRRADRLESFRSSTGFICNAPILEQSDCATCPQGVNWREDVHPFRYLARGSPPALLPFGENHELAMLRGWRSSPLWPTGRLGEIQHVLADDIGLTGLDQFDEIRMPIEQGEAATV
jgi:hypothetical protein